MKFPNPFKIISRIPKKFLFVGIAVLLIGGFFLLPKGNKNTLQFTTAKRQDLKDTVSASGT